MSSAMTVTHPPFLLPESIANEVPPPRMGQVSYVDVRVDGRWEGVLAINNAGECIGTYIGRRVHTLPIPFEPSDITGIRSASRWNLLVTSLPGFLFSFHDLSMVLAFIVCPALLVIGVFCSGLFWVAALVLAVLAWVMMSLIQGFILMRLPTYCAALCSIMISSAGILSRYL